MLSQLGSSLLRADHVAFKCAHIYISDGTDTQYLQRGVSLTMWRCEIASMYKLVFTHVVRKHGQVWNYLVA